MTSSLLHAPSICPTEKDLPLRTISKGSKDDKNNARVALNHQQSGYFIGCKYVCCGSLGATVVSHRTEARNDNHSSAIVTARFPISCRA